jgi:UDP-4-amino-4,6-dideoxy-N-acetyl-beta-L-altrosamine transaminase
MIPYARQSIDENDMQAVLEVLRSDWLTQGPAVERFEQAAAEACGAKHSVAVNSATSALHIAYLALGLGKGDLLWTSPNTFVATSNAALCCGAEVDFVDIDPLTYNISVAALVAKLQSAKRDGRLPKIVVPVHFAGQPCDMAQIAQLSAQYGFHVVEDASHAIGARYGESRTGDCRYSAITIYSFHPVKIITTGEGGMALTNRADLAERMRRLRTHGIVRDSKRIAELGEGAWYYEQVDLGFNYRMTDMQAALGLSQLGRLQRFLARRRELVARYAALLSGLPLNLPSERDDRSSSWHLYVVLLQTMPRAEVFRALRGAGINVNVHYIPVPRQPYYRSLGLRASDYPEAEAYYARCLSLPLYHGLTDEQQGAVADALGRILS